MAKFVDLVTPIHHADNRAVTVRHHQHPYTGITSRAAPKGHRAVALKYLLAIRTKLGLKKAVVDEANNPLKVGFELFASALRFVDSKTIGNTRTLTYQHTYLGLPVWREGVNIRMFDDHASVVSSNSTVASGIKLPSLGLDERELSNPKNERAIRSAKAALTKAHKGLPARLRELAKANGFDGVEILRQETFIFRYQAEHRYQPVRLESKKAIERELFFGLPDLRHDIENGEYRVCVEAFFELASKNLGQTSWRAMVDVVSGDILYLRSNLHPMDGQVFTLDPEQLTGDATLTPGSPASDLNPLRVTVPLLGLSTPAAGAEQALTGEYVVVQDDSAPAVAPPTEPAGDDFEYSAVTDNFAAVNAYYHMDSLFRMVDDWGLDTATYFAGSTFPIPVDHRGVGGAQNAFHSGTDAFARTDRFAFGLLAGGTIGYSILRAACAHEYAHSCLQNQIGDGVFSWCHGFGDALGVVLCDPGSLATDRFARSPFMTSGAGTRRHDRDPNAGWAWGGTFDAGGNSRRRQIMSTSMFRAYRSTGGDSVSSNSTVQFDRRSFASRYLSYLMVGGVGTMTIAVPPASVIDFETALMDFDKTNPDFEGHPGGAFHKVIRWAFEKQGLHKLPADPVDGEGSPPPVDVYIDDGRNGEYEFQSNFWNTTDIWSAQVNDSTVGHQTPLVGVTNYFFVRVQNRGQQTAQNMTVKAYHCIPGTGLVWPVDWTPMDTAEIAVGNLAAGGTTVVGPFEWTPTNVGHECLLASVSADDDESNADTVLGEVPHWRLVPFDNNIAQRNVSPEEPDADALVTSLTDRGFLARNPYDWAVTVDFEVDLPPLLQRREWWVKFHNPGGSRIKLPPRGSQWISFSLQPGVRFKKSDVPKRGAAINIISSIDNQIVGGMTYLIDPSLKKRLPELPTLEGKCIPLAQKLIDCAGFGDQKVKSVLVNGRSVQINF